MNLSGRWRGLACGAALVLLTVAVYIPAMRAGFIWDDNTFLTDNPLIKAPDGLYRFWFSTDAPDYFPLVSSSLWLEWRMWGARAAGYHVVNVLLHAVSAVLVWRVLRRLKVPGAWLAGILFAVHPVNVQSVAWITERKNTLSMLLYLLALLTYLRFESGGRRCRYWLALAIFLLALLSKTSVAMLPVVLLGCAWWQRGRVSRGDLWRSIPFFALSGIMGSITVWFQYNRAMGASAVRADGLLSRLAGAGWAVWFYLYKAIVPYSLSFTYPRWRIDPSSLLSYAPLAGLAACFALFLRYRRTWGRPFLAGLGYFVVTLVPVLGFFNIYYMSYSLVADHWQYVSIVGVIALVAGLGVHAASRWRPAPRRAAAVFALAIVGLLSTLTYKQEGIYRDNVVLWRDTIGKNPRAWMAHINLGIILAERGELDEAAARFSDAILVRPQETDAYNNLGSVLARQGKLDEAIDIYTEALRIDPDEEKTHNNLGNALAGQGRIDDAIGHYSEALRINPSSFGAHYGLGSALAGRGALDEAISHYSTAIRIDPGRAGVHYNLGNALARRGAFEGAVGQYAEALRIEPEYAKARLNMGNAYLEMGRYPQAVRAYREAIRINPGDAAARVNLGIAYLAIGDRVSALDEHRALKSWDRTRAEELFNAIQEYDTSRRGG